jgi:hypothetical protein
MATTTQINPAYPTHPWPALELDCTSPLVFGKTQNSHVFLEDVAKLMEEHLISD